MMENLDRKTLKYVWWKIQNKCQGVKPNYLLIAQQIILPIHISVSSDFWKALRKQILFVCKYSRI